MSKYTILIDVLDQLRSEALDTRFQTRYLPDPTNKDALNQARSRAFVHLFLKVSFGILDFEKREHHMCDGSYDGGVDGYFIDKETRTIHLIQSKFRTTEANFESKPITLEEILAMDVPRIAAGELTDENGNRYNGKVQQLIREISQIDDIGRYKYAVVILANLENWSKTKLSQLTGGFPTEVVDFEASYRDLVFPVISGTYFNASDLKIFFDLSPKNAGTKISYQVTTKHNDCEITALFVPTSEIARVMHRYKNSILKFNPRSYLELTGHVVNDSIRETILNNDTNEFALYNNGITMLSDETYINERIGQRNKAQLILKNPQIINGGQTAYTLSRILEEHANADEVFRGKEVLLKIITLIDQEDKPATATQKLELIDRISTATNQQTPVISADKHSNNQDHLRIQRVLFDRLGLLYERKRGEFADGMHKGYITGEIIIERNLFFRLFMAVTGNISKAVQKKLFMKYETPLDTIADTRTLDRLYFALLCFRLLIGGKPLVNKLTRDRTLYAKLCALSFLAPNNLELYKAAAEEAVSRLGVEWPRFLNAAEVKRRYEFVRIRKDPTTGEENTRYSQSRWLESTVFVEDVEELYGKQKETPATPTQGTS
ncbi:MAG: AIPR family protein [Acidobacteriaceae bacterium]